MENAVPWLFPAIVRSNLQDSPQGKERQEIPLRLNPWADERHMRAVLLFSRPLPSDALRRNFDPPTLSIIALFSLVFCILALYNTHI